MIDFSIKIYDKLLRQLIAQKYTFQTFSGFLASSAKKTVILRHDVDAKNENSLQFAKIQNSLGIVGTYYFRVVPQSFDENIIFKIAALDHEIGYHYETIDTVSSKIKMKNKENQVPIEYIIDLAFEEFCINLEKFRKLVPINTICMHGSPLSKYDNKDIWKKYDFKKLGILGEPYFDLDFNEVGYLTDTGRRWNGSNVSVRDKVSSRYNFNFRSTQEIIKSINALPDKLMFTFHPQRWTDNPIEWTRELILQNIKNQVKKLIIIK